MTSPQEAASVACQEPGHYVVDGGVCLDCRDIRSIVRTDPCEACGKPTPTNLLAEDDHQHRSRRVGGVRSLVGSARLAWM